VSEIERAPAPGGSGEMIFIVDDEDIVLRSAKVVLERRGYRVAAFDTAEKCIARMREENGHCNALITDQTMPGMQGTELVAAAREIIASLPVVIMSGYFSKIPKRTLDQLGQVKLLPKPFTGNELAATLHDAMRMAPVAR
jgi:FixJ family two-component response regulator